MTSHQGAVKNTMELLPCPFCGKSECVRTEHELASTVITQHGATRHNDFWMVVCDVNAGGCGASSGQQHGSDDGAITSWNRRSSGTDGGVRVDAPDLMKLVSEYGVCRYCEGLHAVSRDPNTPLDETIADNSRKAFEAVRAALDRERPVEAQSQPELGIEELASACMSYRHDFGLLPQEERLTLLSDAAAWAHALGFPIKCGTAGAMKAAAGGGERD